MVRELGKGRILCIIFATRSLEGYADKAGHSLWKVMCELEQSCYGMKNPGRASIVSNVDGELLAISTII